MLTLLNDDLIIYILRMCNNKYNLLLTCKKFNNLSMGKLNNNRRGWISYNMSSGMYRKALHYAIMRNQHQLVDKLFYDLLTFTNFNLNSFHESTINISIIYDRFYLYKKLTTQYIDPSFPKNRYFLKACKLGRTEIVDFMMKDKRININQTNVLNCSALVLASEQGHYDVVILLTQNPNIKTNEFIEYASFLAYSNKHTEIYNYLLSL